MSAQDRDAFLVEYEVCMMDVSQLDSDIWQSGSVCIGVSVIGFSLLIQTQAKSWWDFLVYAVLTIFGLAFIDIWYKFVTGWLRLIHVNFFRMREIEAELGMVRERFIQALDEDQGIYAPDKADISEKLSEMKKMFSGKGLGGPMGTRRTLKLLIWFIASGWIALIVKQLIFLVIP